MPPPPLELPSRADAIAAHREAGGAIAAVFPVHYPRALLRAFGLLPVEVWGPPGRDLSGADAHLQAYTCSVVRSSLSFLLAGGLDVAEVLLIPHTCDSLQGLASVLIDFVRPSQRILTLYSPRGRGAARRAFLARELRDLYERLAADRARRPSDADLIVAQQREEAADAALRELLAERRRLAHTDAEIYRIARLREYVPAEAFTAVAGKALANRSDGRPEGQPIVLSGMVPEPLAIFDVIAEAGGWVAADDLACCGRRIYRPGVSADPFERMAESLLSGPPDSAFGSAVADRAEFIGELAAAADARGVVFHQVKFCEPELFYLPQLREALAVQGIASVVIEADVSQPLPQQAVTRLEAFMETIG